MPQREPAEVAQEMAAPFERAIERLTAIIRDFNSITVSRDYHRFYPPAVSSKINLELANLKNAFKALKPEVCANCGGGEARCKRCEWTGLRPAGQNDP